MNKSAQELVRYIDRMFIDDDCKVEILELLHDALAEEYERGIMRD